MMEKTDETIPSREELAVFIIVLYFTKPWGILVLFDWSVLYICKFFIHNDMF